MSLTFNDEKELVAFLRGRTEKMWAFKWRDRSHYPMTVFFSVFAGRAIIEETE